MRNLHCIAEMQFWDSAAGESPEGALEEEPLLELDSSMNGAGFYQRLSLSCTFIRSMIGNTTGLP